MRWSDSIYNLDWFIRIKYEQIFIRCWIVLVEAIQKKIRMSREDDNWSVVKWRLHLFCFLKEKSSYDVTVNLWVRQVIIVSKLRLFDLFDFSLAILWERKKISQPLVEEGKGVNERVLSFSISRNSDRPHETGKINQKNFFAFEVYCYLVQNGP